jgi:integrase
MGLDDALRGEASVQDGRPPLLHLQPFVSGHRHRDAQGERGALEDAQELAGHADARTTRPYVRRQRKIAQAEVERVQLF